MIRLFAALDLPDELRQLLAGLEGGLPGARWVPAENLHITLRFIGNVDEARARGIDEALVMLRMAAFSLEIEGFGYFAAGRKPRSLWAGIARSDFLWHLRDKIETALVRSGVEPERRRFRPHLTMARLSPATPVSKLQNFIAGNNLFRASFAVDSFTLFSSHLGSGTPIYTAQACYPLGH